MPCKVHIGQFSPHFSWIILQIGAFTLWPSVCNKIMIKADRIWTNCNKKSPTKLREIREVRWSSRGLLLQFNMATKSLSPLSSYPSSSTHPSCWLNNRTRLWRDLLRQVSNSFPCTPTMLNSTAPQESNFAAFPNNDFHIPKQWRLVCL